MRRRAAAAATAHTGQELHLTPVAHAEGGEYRKGPLRFRCRSLGRGPHRPFCPSCEASQSGFRQVVQTYSYTGISSPLDVLLRFYPRAVRGVNRPPSHPPKMGCATIHRLMTVYITIRASIGLLAPHCRPVVPHGAQGDYVGQVDGADVPQDDSSHAQEPGEPCVGPGRCLLCNRRRQTGPTRSQRGPMPRV